MDIRTALLLAALALTVRVGAQTHVSASTARSTAGAARSTAVTPRVRAFADSLATLRGRIRTAEAQREARCEDVSPYYYRLITPMYYAGTVARTLRLEDSGAESEDIRSADRTDQLLSDIDHALARAYVERPSAFGHYDKQFSRVDLVAPHDVGRETVQQQIDKTLEGAMLTPDPEHIDPVIDDIGLEVRRPNFWHTEGRFSMQFTQNYFSENWYRGGNNNQTMLMSLTLQANYNDQRRVTWDNKLDMRIGFVTTTSDSCHAFLTNNDKLNLYSKLGVKARKAWYYTTSVEANTQFLPGYRTNDRRTYSNFAAPLDVYVSLGMDFKPGLKNGNSLSVAMLPFSYKLRYIGDRDENIHKVYRLVGKNSEEDFGSKFELNSKMTLAKNFTWRCRCYYFTSYDYAEAELENTFAYAFTRYISTELYTLWRFDDNRSRDYYDRNLGFFQFKEYFTLGLSYAF